MISVMASGAGSTTNMTSLNALQGQVEGARVKDDPFQARAFTRVFSVMVIGPGVGRHRRGAAHGAGIGAVER